MWQQCSLQIGHDIRKKSYDAKRLSSFEGGSSGVWPFVRAWLVLPGFSIGRIQDGFRFPTGDGGVFLVHFTPFFYHQSTSFHCLELDSVLVPKALLIFESSRRPSRTLFITKGPIHRNHK
jgi:hypothetical protein